MKAPSSEPQNIKHEVRSASTSKPKSKSKVCSLGLIWRKKGAGDGTEFRLKNILLKGNSTLSGVECDLCRNPYNPDLMYICCETCTKWYHADAVELEESKLSQLIGFKCCKCRRIRSPLCPYTDQERKIAVESKKPNKRTPKQARRGTDFYPEAISEQITLRETASHVIPTKKELAHPTHERYLNKKIEMYDEMQLVVGKDVATGSYAKSFVDLDAASTETDSNLLENAAESSVPSSQKRPHKKRKQMNSEVDDEGGIKELALEVREIAKAMKDMTKQQLNVSDLYEEVMKVEGFDEIILGAALDFLVEHEMLAKAFMVKNQTLKKIWIQKFAEQYKG